MPDSGPAEISRIQPAPIAFPARAWSGSPLPVSLTSFIGRRDDANTVASLLRRSDVRLVTITGPGGVGKTRLALEVATEIGMEFGDGTAFVDLAPVRAPELVGAAIARRFGLREGRDQSIVDRIVDAIDDRQVLIIFDNFEHIVAAASILIEVLKGCPRVTAVVTSREPLRVSAEHVVVLGPLSLGPLDHHPGCLEESEAVRLFCDRAQAARADFALTEANASIMVDIVRRLDGLPLAIELAAPRLAHLSPAALHQRLERRLPLLTGGARDLPERQKTLRSTLDWSHDLLTPREQRLFRRLAVFLGGCTVDAAENLMFEGGQADPSTLDGLASLVSKNLLQYEEQLGCEPRYTMLETVREYALEQLVERQEEADMRDRHARYFLDLAIRADPATWGGPDQLFWLDKLDAESSNLRGALFWFSTRGDDESFLKLAASLGGFWHYRSHRVEGRDWLIRALEVGGAASPNFRSMAQTKLGMLERVLGRPRIALGLALQGLELRREIGELRGIGRGLVSLGNIYVDLGDYVMAVQAYEEATPLLQVVADIVGQARARLGLGQVAIDQHDSVRGQSLLRDALDLNRQDGFHFGIATTLVELGWAEAANGQVTRAAENIAESISLWQQIRNLEGLVASLIATASLATTARDLELAIRLLAIASSTSEALGYVAPRREAERTERVTRAVRAGLGDRHAALWEAARSQPLRQAVDEARTMLNALTSPKGNLAISPSGGALFTQREMDVLRLLAEGRSDREIGYALGISYRTVTSYVRNVLSKLDVSSRTAAATEAMRRGLVA